MSLPSFQPSWSSAPWYASMYNGPSQSPIEAQQSGWNPLAPVVQGAIDDTFAALDTPVLPLKFDGFDHQASPMPEIPHNGATVPEDTTTPGAANNAASLPDNGGLFSDTQDQLAGLPDLSDIGDYFAGLLASTGDLQQDAAKFNAEQAQLNRQWQEHMSNTAYQRAVSDLKAAGLNPILALGSHNAATTPSGGAASVNTVSGDTVSALISALGSLASSIADFLPNLKFKG